MTIARGQYAFYPVTSTEPSFNSTLGSSGLYALESTGTNRFYQHASGRAIRIASKAADDFSFALGTSDVVATSSGGVLVLGGTVETFFLRPVVSHIMFFSSTDVTANVTLGYGQ